MRRKFILVSRKGVFYAQFWNSLTNSYSSRRSTGTSDRDEALVVVADWMRNGISPDGIPSNLPEQKEIVKKPVSEALTVDAIIAFIRGDDFSKDDASRVLKALKQRNFIENAYLKNSPPSEPLIDFLLRVWQPDGPYISDRRAFKHSITLRHIEDTIRSINCHWKPAFKDMRLGDLRPADIRAFLVKLSESGLSPARINKIYAAGSAPLRWAAANGIIENDPTRGVQRFANIPVKRRGVLSTKELEKLFALPLSAWNRNPKEFKCLSNGRLTKDIAYDERNKTAFAIAATCGLRLGEIVALQAQDIGEDRLFVRHSWNDSDRLKCPKNGEAREVPLLPEIRAMIIRLLRSYPGQVTAETFVFWGRYTDRPIDEKLLSRGFLYALGAIGISDDERKRRGISFHSLRHGYAKAMTNRLSIERAMRATGHKTRAMLEHYADHTIEEDMEAEAIAMQEAFKKVISIKSA